MSSVLNNNQTFLKKLKLMAGGASFKRYEIIVGKLYIYKKMM